MNRRCKKQTLDNTVLADILGRNGRPNGKSAETGREAGVGRISSGSGEFRQGHGKFRSRKHIALQPSRGQRGLTCSVGCVVYVVYGGIGTGVSSGIGWLDS